MRRRGLEWVFYKRLENWVGVGCFQANQDCRTGVTDPISATAGLGGALRTILVQERGGCVDFMAGCGGLPGVWLDENEQWLHLDD